MKKMLIVIGILGLIMLVGCNSGFPLTSNLQNDFCASKGMKYKSGDHKYKTFWCSNCNGEKIAFTLEELENYNCKRCNYKPKPELSCNSG